MADLRQGRNGKRPCVRRAGIVSQSCAPRCWTQRHADSVRRCFGNGDEHEAMPERDNHANVCARLVEDLEDQSWIRSVRPGFDRVRREIVDFVGTALLEMKGTVVDEQSGLRVGQNRAVNFVGERMEPGPSTWRSITAPAGSRASMTWEVGSRNPNPAEA